MDFRIEEVDGQPHVAWTGAGSAAASDGLTIQGGKTRGGCADDLKTLLTRDWQESAGLKGKLLSIGYGLATVSRAAAQLVLTGELEQDRRGRLTFWRIMPLGHHETEEAKAVYQQKMWDAARLYCSDADKSDKAKAYFCTLVARCCELEALLRIFDFVENRKAKNRCHDLYGLINRAFKKHWIPHDALSWWKRNAGHTSQTMAPRNSQGQKRSSCHSVPKTLG